MLYVTTRNQIDPVTANHTLQLERGPEGGCWIPFHEPFFSQEQIAQLKDTSFNATVAQLLNTMFGTRLNAWDVDFSVGRYPVRLRELANRVVIAEPWHNPQWRFENMVSRLTRLVGGEDPGSWPAIGVRIAVLFGIYGELLRQDKLRAGETIDVSVLSGGFTDPMSVWYARAWGLPVENIVCCCNENNSVWNLICHGQFRTDTQSIPTCLRQADVALPEELERLVFHCGGLEELEDYLGCCYTGRMYVPGEDTLRKMRRGLYISVVSSHRLPQTISGVLASHGCLLSPEGALNYSGLQDYRAKKGQLRLSVVMTAASPVCDAGFVAEAAGISEEKLKNYL